MEIRCNFDHEERFQSVPPAAEVYICFGGFALDSKIPYLHIAKLDAHSHFVIDVCIGRAYRRLDV